MLHSLTNEGNISLIKLINSKQLRGATPCYRWSWFEARSKICSAERQAKVRDKNEAKFGTSSKSISFVCNTLVHCEGVDCKVTGIKFMTVFITRRDEACFQLGLQLHCRFVSLGTVHSMPLSAYINQTAVMLDESRGREASTGWVWGLLSEYACEQVEVETWR